MKSAYELAMERLDKQSPVAKLTAEQKAALAEIDQTYQAKIAEREVFLQSLITKARAEGDLMEVENIRLQLSREVQRLKDDCEAKKAKLR